MFEHGLSQVCEVIGVLGRISLGVLIFGERRLIRRSYAPFLADRMNEVVFKYETHADRNARDQHAQIPHETRL